jgi:hypothetical protein
MPTTSRSPVSVTAIAITVAIEVTCPASRTFT